MTAMLEPQYELLFNDATLDSTWWHREPLGAHGFGHQGYYRPVVEAPLTASGDIVDTTGGGGRGAGSPRRPPSFTFGTFVVTLADVFSVWAEGQGVTRDSYVRATHGWWPHQLRGTWHGGAIEIQLAVTSVDRDRAHFQVVVRNRGDVPFTGKLVVHGDQNRSNFADKAWTNLHSEVELPQPAAVAVEKAFDWGFANDLLPIYPVLPKESALDWLHGWFRLGFALGGGGWESQKVSLGERGSTWRMSKSVEIPAQSALTFDVAFTAQWCGSSKPDRGTLASLATGAAAGLNQSFDDALQQCKQRWQAMLARVPALQQPWPEHWLRLYYKAWVVCHANVAPPADMVSHRFQQPSVLANALCQCFIYPASWEQALAALALTQSNPDLASKLIESIYEATEDDGFIAEAVGGSRHSHLPVVEPFVAWTAYQQTQDRAFLERIWVNLRKNLKYRLYHANWRHLGVVSCRNYTYGHLAVRAALKIAKAIERPEHEIRELERWLDQSRRVVDAFWDREQRYYRTFLNSESQQFAKGTNAEALLPLFGVCRPEYRPRLIELIRNHFLTDQGLVARVPHGLDFQDTVLAGADTTTFTLKESNWLYLFKAIKDQDRSLFERILQGVVENIAKANDFWECYQLDGVGRHGGPGTIFGAFAVIWGLLLAEDRVDHLLEEILS